MPKTTSSSARVVRGVKVARGIANALRRAGVKSHLDKMRGKYRTNDRGEMTEQVDVERPDVQFTITSEGNRDQVSVTTTGALRSGSRVRVGFVVRTSTSTRILTTREFTF